jgi:hypothetical protein
MPGEPAEPAWGDASVPYYTFPPFPQPPDGSSLIAFKDFKPLGIHIPVDEDEQELDGSGLPTVTLNTVHDINKHKKRPKRKRKTNPDGTPAAPPAWWEEWEEDDHTRSAPIVDQ